MDFVNSYEDAKRANAYSTLQFANTYFLAYRDLPAIIANHVAGKSALDFGCGTGRSTRFLQSLGFDVIGVDSSEDMLRLARDTDPSGDYRLIPGDDFTGLGVGNFDLVLSAFTLDNVPGVMKGRIISDLGKLLTPNGAVVSIVSSPEIYTHEWASFSTKDFPENASAKSGDVVRIVVTDLHDRRPVEDILCTDDSYQEIFANAGLNAIQTLRPLATRSEPYAWDNETTLAPWVIYVLKRAS
ncbi:MAG TPA: class I SAM-dependent methyltransferase [Candidatus Eremiobacteraceae bacterium]